MFAALLLSAALIVGTNDSRWTEVVNRGLATANRYWPERQSCRGQERFIIVDEMPPKVVGQADPVTCRIWLLRSEIKWKGWSCSTVVHEVGHLRGRPHSPRRESIMHPYILRQAPACLVD